jgi:hypothetical protein
MGRDDRLLASKIHSDPEYFNVAASMLKAIYHMLKDGTLHQDLGADYFARRSKQSRAKQYVKHLASLGYHVEITPMPNAA